MAGPTLATQPEGLKHRAEKWLPVFGKNDATSKASVPADILVDLPASQGAGGAADDQPGGAVAAAVDRPAEQGADRRAEDGAGRAAAAPAIIVILVAPLVAAAFIPPRVIAPSVIAPSVIARIVAPIVVAIAVFVAVAAIIAITLRL